MASRRPLSCQQTSTHADHSFQGPKGKGGDAAPCPTITQSSLHEPIVFGTTLDPSRAPVTLIFNTVDSKTPHHTTTTATSPSPSSRLWQVSESFVAGNSSSLVLSQGQIDTLYPFVRLGAGLRLWWNTDHSKFMQAPLGSPSARLAHIFHYLDPWRKQNIRFSKNLHLTFSLETNSCSKFSLSPDNGNKLLSFTVSMHFLVECGNLLSRCLWLRKSSSSQEWWLF